MNKITLPLWLLFSEMAFALTEEPAAKPDAAPLSLSWWDVFVPLLMVIVLIVAVAWATRRLNPKLATMGLGRDIKIISTTALSNHAKLMLVRVDGHDLLVGVTQGNVSLIKDFHGEIGNREESSISKELESAGAKFAQRLQRFKRPKPENDPA